jgi:hypothetical protein
MGMGCACGHHVDLHIHRGCLVLNCGCTKPPPLAPAPPAWKGESFDPTVTMYPSDYFAPPSDPVTDFIARRVAKRAVKFTPDRDNTIMHGRTWEAFHAEREAAYERADALSRAMSTPGPHDPDIHTRLMPWRGKE